MHKFTGTPTMENSNVLNLRSKITENRFGPWHPPPAYNMLFLYRWYNWIAKLSRTLMLVSRYQHKCPLSVWHICANLVPMFPLCNSISKRLFLHRTSYHLMQEFLKPHLSRIFSYWIVDKCLFCKLIILI